MLKLVFLISGGGSNMQAVIDLIERGGADAEVCAVISSNSTAFGLERAKKHGIDSFVIDKAAYPSQAAREERICEIVDKHNADYIILAGYLSILSEKFTEKYARRIINIHPSLLPKFGGAGMYGINVHKAVLACGTETKTGATVHYVDKGTDTGEIIAQGMIDILPSDTPETLQKRVLTEVEHKLLPSVVARLASNKR